ncbi:conserved hypothetical protein [Neospora caninum Liverpool]|uniref:Uncharacterized protein n=1 Tax=Neospora caninum (strain Liverpool) TaxID=572307 RepID=F0VJL2_NEOCL|nr:conserved hypothetical protein [Neospora caninum Liverpool]CBZ53923.1 conserved hypothetical protein [Neospora caninum Liverpool]|eukprot:XP_003883955.1 conserved hypothetical protein [Neospora caninum Liverpool]
MTNPWPPVDSNEVTTASMVDSGPASAASESCASAKNTVERSSATPPEGQEHSSTSPKDSDPSSRYRLAAVAASALAAAVARKQRREASDSQAAAAGQAQVDQQNQEKCPFLTESVLGRRHHERREEPKRRGNENKSDPLFQFLLLDSLQKASFRAPQQPDQAQETLVEGSKSPETARATETFLCQPDKDNGRVFSSNGVESQATPEITISPGGKEDTTKGPRRPPGFTEAWEMGLECHECCPFLKSTTVKTILPQKTSTPHGQERVWATSLSSQGDMQVRHTKGHQSASVCEPCEFPNKRRHLQPSAPFPGRSEAERQGFRGLVDGRDASAGAEPDPTLRQSSGALETILDRQRTLNHLPAAGSGARELARSALRHAPSKKMNLTKAIASSLADAGRLGVSTLLMRESQLQTAAGVLGDEALQRYMRAASALLHPNVNTSDDATLHSSGILADNQPSDEDPASPGTSTIPLFVPSSSPVSSGQSLSSGSGKPTHAVEHTPGRLGEGIARRSGNKESCGDDSKTEDAKRFSPVEMNNSSATAAATAAAVAALLAWKKPHGVFGRVSADCDGSDEKNSLLANEGPTKESPSLERHGKDEGEELICTKPREHALVRHSKQEQAFAHMLPRGVLLDAARVLLATSGRQRNDGGNPLPLNPAMVQLLLPTSHDSEGSKHEHEDRATRSPPCEAPRQSQPPSGGSFQASRASLAARACTAYDVRAPKSTHSLACDSPTKAPSNPGGAYQTERGRDAYRGEPPHSRTGQPTASDAHLASHRLLESVNASDDELVEATAAALRAIGRLLTLRASRLPTRQTPAGRPVHASSKPCSFEEAHSGVQAAAACSGVQKETEQVSGEEAELNGEGGAFPSASSLEARALRPVAPQAERDSESADSGRLSSCPPPPPLSSLDPEEAFAEIRACQAPPPSPAHATPTFPKGPLEKAALPSSILDQQQSRKDVQEISRGASCAEDLAKANAFRKQVPKQGSSLGGPSSFANDQGVLQLLLQAHESLQRSLASNASSDQATAHTREASASANRREDRHWADRRQVTPRALLKTARREAMKLLGFQVASGKQRETGKGDQPSHGTSSSREIKAIFEQPPALPSRCDETAEASQPDLTQSSKRSKPLNPYATPFVPRFALASPGGVAASATPLGSGAIAPSVSRQSVEATPVSSLSSVPAARAAVASLGGSGDAQERLEAWGVSPRRAVSEKNSDILALLGAVRSERRSSEPQKVVLDSPLHNLLQKNVATRRADRPRRLRQLPEILHADSQAFLAALRRELAPTREAQEGHGEPSPAPLKTRLPGPLASKEDLRTRHSAEGLEDVGERAMREADSRQGSALSRGNKQTLRPDGRLHLDTLLPPHAFQKTAVAQTHQSGLSSLLPHHVSPALPHIINIAPGVQAEKAFFLQSAAKKQPVAGWPQLHLSRLLVPETDLRTSGSAREVTRNANVRSGVQRTEWHLGDNAGGGAFGNTDRSQTNTGLFSSALSQDHLTLLNLQHRMHALQQQANQVRISSTSSNVERHPYSSPLPPQADCPSSVGKQPLTSVQSKSQAFAADRLRPGAATEATRLHYTSGLDSLLPGDSRMQTALKSTPAAVAGHTLFLTRALGEHAAQRDAEASHSTRSILPPVRLPDSNAQRMGVSYLLGSTGVAPVAAAETTAANLCREQTAETVPAASDGRDSSRRCRPPVNQADGKPNGVTQGEALGSHVAVRKGRNVFPSSENQLSLTQPTQLLQATLLALSRGGSSLSPALLGALGAAAASPEVLLGHLRSLTGGVIRRPSGSERALGEAEPRRGVSSSDVFRDASKQEPSSDSAQTNTGEQSSERGAVDRLPSPQMHHGRPGVYSKVQLLKSSQALLRQQERKTRARTKAGYCDSSADGSGDEETNLVRQSLPFVERVAPAVEAAPAHGVRDATRAPLSPGIHTGPRMLPPGRSKVTGLQGSKVTSRAPPLLPNIFPPSAAGDEGRMRGAAEAGALPEAEQQRVRERQPKLSPAAEGIQAVASPAGATCGSSRPSSAASVFATVDRAVRDAHSKTADEEGTSQKGSSAADEQDAPLRLPRRRGSVPTHDKGKDQKPSETERGGGERMQGREGGKPRKRRGSTSLVSPSAKAVTTRSAAASVPAARLPKTVFAEDSRDTKTEKKTGEKTLVGEAGGKDAPPRQSISAALGAQLSQGAGKLRGGKRGNHTQRGSSSSSRQEGNQAQSRGKVAAESSCAPEAADGCACPVPRQDSQKLPAAPTEFYGVDSRSGVETAGGMQKVEDVQKDVEPSEGGKRQGMPEDSESHTKKETVHQKVQKRAFQPALVAQASASVVWHLEDVKDGTGERTGASVSACVWSSSETNKPKDVKPLAGSRPKHHGKAKVPTGKQIENAGLSAVPPESSKHDGDDAEDPSSGTHEVKLKLEQQGARPTAASHPSDEIYEKKEKNKEETSVLLASDVLKNTPSHDTAVSISILGAKKTGQSIRTANTEGACKPALGDLQKERDNSEKKTTHGTDNSGEQGSRHVQMARAGTAAERGR